MDAGIRQAGLLDPNDPRVEGIAKDAIDAAAAHEAQACIHPAAPAHHLSQFSKGVVTSGIESEQLTYDWGCARVMHLDMPWSLVAIAERRWQRIQPLSQMANEALAHFLPKIANVVGGDHGLNVGGQPTATGVEAKVIVGKTHVDTNVDQIADLSPVPEVAGTPVDFVNDEPLSVAPCELAHHMAKLYPTGSRGRLAFLKPFADLEPSRSSVCLNRHLLLR